jgi:hypothetical protein
VFLACIKRSNFLQNIVSLSIGFKCFIPVLCLHASVCMALAMDRQTRIGRLKEHTHSVALSPQAKYTDWATATFRRNLVSTSADRGVSRGQRGGFPTVVNLSVLDLQI